MSSAHIKINILNIHVAYMLAKVMLMICNKLYMNERIAKITPFSGILLKNI